jgi:IMP dehydrogenase
MATAEYIFSDYFSRAYDDIIMLPGYIDFDVEDVSLKSMFTKNITLNTPFISSPMDTVTESKLAIHLALQGGIGIIHYNNTVEEQIAEIKKVKRFNNGFIENPIVVSSDSTVKEIKDMVKRYGFNGFPVTKDGNMGTVLLGMVSNRDIDYVTNLDTKVSEVMVKDLTTAKEGCTLKEAFTILKSSKMSRLPVVDDAGNITSLICRKDLQNANNYPLATINEDTNQLMVGAAVSTHKKDRKRIDELIEAGADVLVVDSSQGNSKYQIETINYICSVSNTVEIVAGNIVTSNQARTLIRNCKRVSALRVGMGIGSICTTQEVCGVGRGQASAIYDISHCDDVVQNSIPVIADGGISNTGHIIKALVLGASTVMMGSMFAGTDESPGDYIYDNGVRLKKYRGMGCLDVIRSREEVASRYLTKKSTVLVAQGVSGMVTGKGSINKFVPYLAKGVKHGMQDMGCKDIYTAHKMVNKGDVQMELRSASSFYEGSVHHMYTHEKN